MKKCRVCRKPVGKVYDTHHLKGACRACVESIYDRLGIDIAYDDLEDRFYESATWEWQRWPLPIS